MHDWLGFGLIVFGFVLGIAGILKRRRRNRAFIPVGAIRPEFASMGEIVRPMALFVVGLIAFMMSLFYFVFSGDSLLTPLQYAGLMFFLACYSGYLVAATAKPALSPSPAAAPEPSGMRSAT